MPEILWKILSASNLNLTSFPSTAAVGFTYNIELGLPVTTTQSLGHAETGADGAARGQSVACRDRPGGWHPVLLAGCGGRACPVRFRSANGRGLGTILGERAEAVGDEEF